MESPIALVVELVRLVVALLQLKQTATKKGAPKRKRSGADTPRNSQ